MFVSTYDTYIFLKNTHILLSFDTPFFVQKFDICNAYKSGYALSTQHTAHNQIGVCSNSYKYILICIFMHSLIYSHVSYLYLTMAFVTLN